MPTDPQNTTNLGLPYIMPAQAQKFVTHNAALNLLDALVQPMVLDKDLSTPPATPSDGDRYVVASGGTGDWSGKDNHLVAFTDGAWSNFAPKTGWVCYVADEGRLYGYDGTDWFDVVTGFLTVLQNLSLLGIGTTADATNPFSAKLNGTLWTARYAAEGGTGDLRYTLNKETSSATASLLFQTAYSGRAELGLTGGDDLAIKVSADGTTWQTSLVVDNSTGNIGLGTDAPLAKLHIRVAGGAPAAGMLSGGEHLAISDENGGTSVTGIVASTASTDRMVFKGTRSAGTLVAPTTPAVGAYTFSLLGAAYDGTTTRVTAGVSFVVDGTVSSGVGPQRIIFETGAAASRTERMRIDSAGQAYFQGVGTTASAANAVLNASSSPANALLRSTSSLAYKTDVEPAAPACSHALMAVQPIWYRSTAPLDRSDWSWWGFAAEDVAEIDPRMVSWGYREEDYEWVEVADAANGGRREPRLKPGAEQKPDGVAYDRFVVHHHQVIKELLDRVATLEGTLSARRDAPSGEISKAR